MKLRWFEVLGWLAVAFETGRLIQLREIRKEVEREQARKYREGTELIRTAAGK